MQFKHPEILYALLLLIIPILVHLFQLQKFKKTPFTNVQFLKKIEQQTRKSSKLKKYLILAMRVLAFTCIIFAFSQPYFSNITADQKIETSIYLDNSLSMQAKNENGEILKNTAQTIIENFSEVDEQVSLLTNNQNFKNITKSILKNELVKLDYTANKQDLSTILLQFANQKNNKTNTLHNYILFSDFQDINLKNKESFTNVNSQILLVNTQPTSNQNIFIDSVYISEKNSSSITLKSLLKSLKPIEENIAVSLIESNKLIGKTTAKFLNSSQTEVSFTIPNQQNFNGKISISVDDIAFDNDFYFSISNPEKINILSIGKPSNYLAKIYRKNEFNFVQNPIQNLNYNIIQNQHFIVLNELGKIPNELTSNIVLFFKNGGNLVIIPSPNSNLNSYNNLFQKLELGSIQPKIESEHQITTINFEHPLLKDVFEKKVNNFQYPKSNFYYPSKFYNSTSVISFDNTKAFISSSKNNQVHWIASSLSKNSSNFLNSPLIVPVFYNMAKSSFINNTLYYTIKNNQTFTVNTSIRKDEVLTLSNHNSEFIPLQQSTQNKVQITLQDQPIKSGFYALKRNNETIQTLAFNYNREESDLNYMNIDELSKNNPNIKVYNSIDDVFEIVNNNIKINWLFKWFLAFSILFLLIEMLILKYFKI